MRFYQITRVRQGFDDDVVIILARPLSGGPEDFSTAPLIDHPAEGSIIAEAQLRRFQDLVRKSRAAVAGAPR